MLYAKINVDGTIIDVATTQSEEYSVLVAPDEPTVASILERKFADSEENAASILANSDNEMMRILEDLIDLLSQKRLIQFTELPLAAQKKLLSRKWVRNAHSNNDDTLIIDSELTSKDDSLI